MELADVRKGLADSLGTIEGLRVFDYMPESAEPPCAVVGFPETLEFDKAFARGLDEYPSIPIYLFVGRADARASQEKLGAYCAGAGALSIKEAVESDKTLGNVCDTATVVRVRGFRLYPMGATEFLGCVFDVRVVG